MHRNQMRLRFAKSLCLILGLGWGAACDAHAKTCSHQDAEAADAAVDVLDSWTKLQWAVKKFGHCDAGSIAEGNSEAVARLLVDHWNTLPLLAKLVRRDPALKRYVLRHIDTTLDTDDLGGIQSLASSQCPEGSGLLCGELLKAAARASP
jgi:hypothetical protein